MYFLTKKYKNNLPVFRQTACTLFGNDCMKHTFDITNMRNSAHDLVGTLKSIANADRLLILCKLAQRELNVSQIEEITKINQPTLSQQLMMLRKSDVVKTRREGKQIFYSIKDQNIIHILNTLHDLYCCNKNHS